MEYEIQQKSIDSKTPKKKRYEHKRNKSKYLRILSTKITSDIFESNFETFLENSGLTFRKSILFLSLLLLLLILLLLLLLLLILLLFLLLFPLLIIALKKSLLIIYNSHLIKMLFQRISFNCLFFTNSIIKITWK